MNSEFEALGAKYKALRLAADALCRTVIAVVADLNSGMPANSDMIKGELNRSLDDFSIATGAASENLIRDYHVGQGGPEDVRKE
ncbi:MAG TPA: hypothetical protein HPP87_04650 [Planctomycetes bacterium]|nr:hypothetical protein [Planctomycetota bacterium]